MSNATITAHRSVWTHLASKYGRLAARARSKVRQKVYARRAAYYKNRLKDDIARGKATCPAAAIGNTVSAAV